LAVHRFETGYEVSKENNEKKKNRLELNEIPSTANLINANPSNRMHFLQ